MNKITREHREYIVFCFAFASAAVAVVGALALIGIEAYVRWTLNKDFMFLGGSSLSALIISAFVLMAGMVYAYRPENR
ncbi:MAG TPA: hypothetical protein VMV62_02250 [Candidatus Paceibacterota bacterium]|nr:hypothetical protein [Candidatus Paceibacterota bacterium]